MTLKIFYLTSVNPIECAEAFTPQFLNITEKGLWIMLVGLGKKAGAPHLNKFILMVHFITSIPRGLLLFLINVFFLPKKYLQNSYSPLFDFTVTYYFCVRNSFKYNTEHL